MILFLYILSCSVIGFVYSELLTEPSMILNKPFHLIVLNLPEWLHKPLISCSKCVTGQIALWTYLYFYYDSYSPFTHVFFICLSILITWLLNNLKKILER